MLYLTLAWLDICAQPTVHAATEAISVLSGDDEALLDFRTLLPAPCSDFMPADVARRSGQMCDTKVGVLLYTGSETWLFADGDWTCALLRSRLTLLPRGS